MEKDVHEWVISCEVCCQKKSPQQKHIHSPTTWKPSHPFWQVALDIMGPLPESSGNKYILLIGDQFTKWCEAIPMSNQEASTVAKAFVNVWVSMFGCPANLHSEKGSNFMSNLFKNMCKELGINRTSTTAYHPQGNAMIEPTNRTIEESLAKYACEHHNTWSDYLPLVMMAYRSSIHSVTKYSPFYLLLGRSCALQIDCMYQTIQTKICPTLSDYVGCLKDELQTCHELFRESMDVEQERQKTYYDRSTFGPQYEVGDLVMMINPTMKTGQTKKFKSFYSEPQVKREIINDLNFVFEDVKTKKQQKVHYDRLKRFNSRSATTDKQEPKKAKSEPRISQNDLTDGNDFVEVEVDTPRMNDTGRREVNPEENNNQINHSTEAHNETVQEELFETPIGGSTRKSINNNTKNKRRSTNIPAPKVATQQKRDNLVATSERSEGEEFSNRSMASTSQSVTE